MIRAYDELYLNKARTSLARMLDFAVHELHQDAESFFRLFISSGTASLFEHGDIRTVVGMSGIELAYRVLEISGLGAERISYRYTAGRSKEYWTGWALAYYQWQNAIPFADIIRAVPITSMIEICDSYRSEEVKALSEGLSWMDTVKVPDHMNEDNYLKFSSYLSEKLRSFSDETNLKRIRQQNGLSQSRLAAISGVPVRTIQQYEQRQKDINKANFEHIIKLAAALSCEPIQLLDRILK